MVDATLVEVPRQHHSREDHETIKEGRRARGLGRRRPGGEASSARHRCAVDEKARPGVLRVSESRQRR